MLQKWLLWALVACVSVTVVATIVATLAAARYSKLTSELSRITKGYRASSVALEELRDRVDALMDRYETLRARVGMRETREKRNSEPKVEELTGAAWKEAKRAELRAIQEKARGA